MVEIVTELHKYVPVITSIDDCTIDSTGDRVEVPKAKFCRILFGGDHLTAERGRGALRIRMNSDTPTKRLEGIEPVTEDWHAKLNLLQVCIFSTFM